MSKDIENENNRYKERMQDMNQQIALLKEQLSEAYATGDMKSTISTLLEKQNVLVAKLREAGKKEMSTKTAVIQNGQVKMRMNLIEQMLPARLVQETQLACFTKIQTMNHAKHKAMLLFREICEKHLMVQPPPTDDEEQRLLFVKFLINIVA